MKSYLRLTCSACLRTIDRAINNTHYTPDKCTITLGCEGRLNPVDTVSNPTIAVTPETGIKDWHPRQLKEFKIPEALAPARKPTVHSTGVISINDNLVSGETGTLKQIVLAIKPLASSRLTATPDTVQVVFDVAPDKPREYKHFILRADVEFTEIAASDPRLNPRPLRYNVVGANPDIVEIRVNGILRERSNKPDGYTLFDGSGKVAPNSVVFNSPVEVLGRAQVDITVTKGSAATNTTTATFKKQTGVDEARIKTGAYENVSSVQRFNSVSGLWETFELYVMDLDASGLKLNSLLVPASVQIDSTMDFKNAFFLVAKAPYTQVDRYTGIVTPFTGFSFENKKYIKYYEDTQLKMTTLRVTADTITTVYPPLRFDTFTVEKPLKIAIAGMTEQVTIDGNLIVGPD